MKHCMWILWTNPKIGQDSYGQTNWLHIECCHIMQSNLYDLEDNGRQKCKPEFKAYLKAVETVSDLGKKKYTDRTFSAST